MKSLILLGTAHKFQKPDLNIDIESIEEFRAAIRELCSSYHIRAIAEEMNREALEEHDLEDSIANQICKEIQLCHQYSNPTNKQRIQMGIRQENDIRAEHMFDGLGAEKLKAEVNSHMAAYDKIREKFWWSRIMELNVWPLLFICGANHFVSFAALANENGAVVTEAFPDWKPRFWVE